MRSSSIAKTARGSVGRLVRLLTDEGPAPDLFVRDAAAQAPRAIGAAALRLDAPAFLTAQALGLTPALYAAFERVEVSQHLPIALQQIERDLLGPQPEPSGPAAQTLALLEAAAIDGRVSVTTLGLKGDQPSEADITAGLIALGQLTPARAAALGLDPLTIADQRLLPSGDPIHLSGQVLAAVASAGLLRETLATWSLTIDADTLAAVRREADGERRTHAAAQCVGVLRRAVVDDIRNDRLQSLPRQTSDDASANGVLESLRDLRMPGDAVIWTEDRAIDLRSDIDGIAVVEAYDVIAHLRGRGQLNADQATEAMRRLRDAGFRFLPIEVDELVALLRAAPIVAHAVVETRELAAVRRAFARDLLQEAALRLAPDAEMKTAENRFVLRAFRLFDDALRRVWSGRYGVAKKRAWSDWLCVALGCERLDRAPLTAPDEASRQSLYEIYLASRVSFGYVIGGSRKAREAAFEWVWARLLAPEFEADAALGVNVRKAFAAFWSEPFFDEDGTRPADTPEARRERAAVCAAGLSHMPEKMRDFLLAEPQLRTFVEAGFKRRLSVGSLVFPADSVLDAAIAVSGSDGAVRHVEPDDGAMLTVRAVGEGVDITSETSSTIARLAGDQLALVVGDLDARTAVTERLFTAAEVPAGSDDAARLATLETPYERLVALHDIEADTIGGRLEEIVRLAAAGRLTVESLAPPPPAALRHWWRWPAGASINPAQLQAAVGGQWLGRIAAAPLRAWSTFETAADPYAAALRDLPSRLVSPLGALARLALIAKDSAPEEIHAGVAYVMDRFKVDGDDFVDLVGLFQRQADLDPRWRAEAPDFAALAMWAWTDLVWRTLAQSGHVPAPLAAFWRKVVGRRPRAMVVEARAAVASAPPWTGAGRLLAVGLAVALGPRREAIWTDALTSDVARFVLDAAREHGPVAVGPLTLAPDRSLTWLADASPFIWAASGDLAAAIDDALDNYPQDEAKMAALVLAGPDVIHPEAASRLVAKLADLWCDGRPGVPDRWVAELQYLGVALKSFVRRGALDIGERERILVLFETILATLTRHADWNRLREGVYHFVFNHVLAVSVDALAAFLTHVFECARELERPRIMEIAAIYLAGLPFEERGPLWRAHLEMRARR